MRRGPNGRVANGASRIFVALALAALAVGFWTTGSASAGTLFAKIPGELAEAPEGLYAPTAALLPGGKVLIAGGYNPTNKFVKTAQLFDPATGMFTKLAAEMAVGRDEESSVALPSGKVLIVGGYNSTNKALSTAELFNPATNSFEAPATEMTTARDGPGAALLPGGKVLIVDGENKAGVAQTSAELYDPATAKFEALSAAAHTGRYQPGVVALPNGKVLIAGGYLSGKYLETAEIYDPATNTFQALEGAGHELTEHRDEMAAVLLQNGLVLIAGGYNEISKELATEETFNFETNTFEKLGTELVERRESPAALALSDGRVLIAAGYGEGVYLKTAEETSISLAAATTTAASSVGQSTATLNGTVLTEAVASTYFQYGTTTTYGSSSARLPVGGAMSSRPVSAAVAGLAPGTTFHFRVVAENAGGTSYGADQTLTTQPAPAKPQAPRITGLSESHHSWREGSKLARISAHRPPIGTAFKLTLSAPASIHLVFSQQVSGRKVNRRCVAQTHANRSRRSCKRTLTRGGIILTGHAGTNKINFQGRVSHARKLPLGTYTVTITATSAAGHSSPQHLTFTIVG